jgi:hypothetical protein
LPIRGVTSTAARAWLSFVRFALLASVAFLLIFPVLVHDGPLSQDLYFNSAYPIYFACVSYCSSEMVRILKSNDVSQMLLAAEGGKTSDEIAGRIYSGTSKVALEGLLIAAIVVATVMPCIVRCLLDEVYIGEDVSVFYRFVGFGGLTVLTLSLPIAAIVNVCANSHIPLLLTISRVQVAAAFDELHPKLAELGLQRFAPHAPLTTLHVTPGALLRFTSTEGSIKCASSHSLPYVGQHGG